MNRDEYNLIKSKIETLEKLLNGGKGSGNFGHSGRPGMVGGSGDGLKTHEISHEADLGYYVEDGDRILASGKTKEEALEKAKQKKGKGKTPFKVGDTYMYGGNRMTVQEGEHGLEGVSEDGQIVSELPSEEAIERDKKLAKQIDDEIADNISKISQASMALKEGDVRNEEETRKYIDEMHEKRQALRDRLSNIQSRIERYETALLRKKNVEQIDKIIGSEKIKEGVDKKTDDANYKKLQSDISKIKKILSTEKSRENFGQEEVRKLRDKYSDYMSGNYNVTERFVKSVQDFEDWADNYTNGKTNQGYTDEELAYIFWR